MGPIVANRSRRVKYLPDGIIAENSVRIQRKANRFLKDPVAGLCPSVITNMCLGELQQVNVSPQVVAIATSKLGLVAARDVKESQSVVCQSYDLPVAFGCKVGEIVKPGSLAEATPKADDSPTKQLKHNK